VAGGISQLGFRCPLIPEFGSEFGYLIHGLAGRANVAHKVDVERPPEFFIDNLLVRMHFIIVMIRWTGLAPWEFEFPFAKVPERKFFIDNLLVRMHFIIMMFRWTGLAPWEFEFLFAKLPERKFFTDNLLVRIHFIIVMIRWTGHSGTWSMALRAERTNLRTTTLQKCAVVPRRARISGS